MTNTSLHRDSESGTTLVEMMSAIPLLLTGLLSVAGLLGTTSRQNEQAESSRFVLEQAQSLLERVMATAPDVVQATYDGELVDLLAAAQNAGMTVDAATLTVDVDSTLPSLLVVTVTGTWTVQGAVETLSLNTRIYNP